MTTIRVNCAGRELHVVGDRDDGPAGAARRPRRSRRRARPRRRPGRSSARRGRGRPGPWPGCRRAPRACAATGRGRTGWSCARRRGRPPRGCRVTSVAISAAATPRFRGPNATSRSTERSNSWSSGFWKTNPTVARELGDGRPSVGSPSSRTRPGVRSQQAVEVLDQRGLARAVLAEDGDGLARLDGQRHAADGFDAARVAMDEAVDRDAGRCVGPAAASRPRPVRAAPLRGRAERGCRRRRAVAPAPPSRPAPAAMRRLVEGRRQGRATGGPGEPDEGRRRRGRCGLGVRQAPPGTSSATGRPASRTRQRSIRPRTLGSCSAHRIARPARASSSRRSATAAVPAGSSWAVGSSRTRTVVPIATMLAMATRCCSPPDRANGSRSARWRDAQARERRRRSARPSRRAGRRGSRARTRAPRARSASRPTAGWPASRRRCRLARAGHRRAPMRRPTPSTTTRPPSLRPDHARDEPGGRQRQRRLAGAGPPGDPDALAGGHGRRRRRRGSVRAGQGSGPSGRRSSRGASGRAVGSAAVIARRLRARPARSRRPRRRSAVAASGRSAGRRRSDRRSAPAVPRTRAPRARTSARGHPRANRAGPAR